MEPDNDAVFAAEAEIPHNGMRPRVSRTRSGSGHTGEFDVLATRGGIDPGLNDRIMGEQEPLLGNRDTDEEDASHSNGSDWPGSKDFDHLPWYKRPSIYWMLVPFFVMTLAYGGVVTPRINLILNLVCREYLSEQKALDPNFTALPVMFDGENPQCRIPEVQARVSQFTLYGNLIAGLLSAIISPKLGALSDRYGRTKLIALTSLGSLGADIVTILAARSPETFTVNWILIGFALDGLCGSFTTAFAIVHAYATDCTPPALRSVAFSYFHGCLFTGFAIGPILAGLVVRATGTPLSVFYVMMGVHVLFMIFTGFIAPESLSKSRKQTAQDKHKVKRDETPVSNDWIDTLRKVNIFEPLNILWPRGPGTSNALRRNLALLAAVDTMMFGVAMGSITIIIIYANYQFGWETFESSVFMSIVNTFRVFFLVVALPIATYYVRGSSKDIAKNHKNTGSDTFDLVIIRVAVFFDTLGYLGYTLARTGPLLIASGVVASIGGIGSPTLQSALTKHVPADRTGQLLGASGLLHALARVVAPTIFNAIYSATVGKFDQTVFVCLTATFAVAFVTSWFVKPHVYMDTSKLTDEDEEVDAQDGTVR